MISLCLRLLAASAIVSNTVALWQSVKEQTQSTTKKSDRPSAKNDILNEIFHYCDCAFALNPENIAICHDHAEHSGLTLCGDKRDDSEGCVRAIRQEKSRYCSDGQCCDPRCAISGMLRGWLPKQLAIDEPDDVGSGEEQRSVYQIKKDIIEVIVSSCRCVHKFNASRIDACRDFGVQFATKCAAGGHDQAHKCWSTVNRYDGYCSSDKECRTEVCVEFGKRDKLYSRDMEVQMTKPRAIQS